MDIQDSFTQTIKKTSLPDALGDFSEVGIDSLLSNDLLKQIPIIKTFVGVLQAGVNVNDRLFLKKVLAFLDGIDDIPAVRRQEMIDEIDRSKKYRLKVGEKLLYVIDKCNDYENSEKVSILFKAMLEEKIEYDQFIEAAEIVSRITAKDLALFIDSFRLVRYMDDSASQLQHTGLVIAEVEDIDVDIDEDLSASVTGGEITYKPSPAGIVVFEVFGGGVKKRENEIMKARERKKSELRRKNAVINSRGVSL